MKLIIDIDDEQVLFDIKNRGLEAETETDKVIINALYNGIPLDDVKAKIEDNAIKDVNGEGFIFLDRLLRILDNTDESI